MRILQGGSFKNDHSIVVKFYILGGVHIMLQHFEFVKDLQASKHDKFDLHFQSENSTHTDPAVNPSHVYLKPNSCSEVWPNSKSSNKSLNIFIKPGPMEWGYIFQMYTVETTVSLLYFTVTVMADSDTVTLWHRKPENVNNSLFVYMSAWCYTMKPHFKNEYSACLFILSNCELRCLLKKYL